MFLILSAFAIQAQPATNALTALVPAYGEITPTFWERYHLSILIGVFLLLVLAGALIWRHLCPGAAPQPPPEKIARDALAQLQNQPEDGHVLSAVSQILRGYFSERLSLTTGELTTAEFIAAVARSDKIDLTLGESACSFLRECDVQKFSATHTAAPINAVNRALEIIDLAEARCMEIKTQPGGPRD